MIIHFFELFFFGYGTWGLTIRTVVFSVGGFWSEKGNNSWMEVVVVNGGGYPVQEKPQKPFYQGSLDFLSKWHIRLSFLFHFKNYWLLYWNSELNINDQLISKFRQAFFWTRQPFEGDIGDAVFGYVIIVMTDVLAVWVQMMDVERWRKSNLLPIAGIAHSWSNSRVNVEVLVQ